MKSSVRSSCILPSPSPLSQDEMVGKKVEEYFGGVGREDNERILKSVEPSAILALKYVSDRCHTAVDKLEMLVKALEEIDGDRGGSGDELLEGFIRHLVVAIRGEGDIVKARLGYHKDLKIIEEFCRDDVLLRGKEGYTLAILQSSLMFLKNIPVEEYGKEIFGAVVGAGGEGV